MPSLKSADADALASNVRGLTAVSPVPTPQLWNAIVLSFGFSAAVDVFFGICPARKASQLDPIVALRYE
jgi:ABC-type lipoprotein release transport system permease subunit